MNTLRIHTEAIRTRVCTECLLPSGMGLCGTGAPEDCPLNRFLPRAIDAVIRGEEKSILDYFKSLHRSDAPEDSDDRVVTHEEALWLEEFLPLIEVAVEESGNRDAKRSERFH